MRTLFAVLFAALLLAPAAVAEEAPLQPLHGCDSGNPDEHCHDDDKDTPGVGAVAFIGLLGAVAFLARRS